MILSDLLLITAPFVGVACCGLIHIAAANVMPKARSLVLMVGSFFVGAGACLALSYWAAIGESAEWSDRFGSSATALLTYGGFAYCYINFVNVAIASLRIRLITELAAAENGSSIEELTAKYGVRDVVATRLERLTSARQIDCREGRYLSRPSAVYRLALLVSLTKRILFGRRWGRDWD